MNLCMSMLPQVSGNTLVEFLLYLHLKGMCVLSSATPHSLAHHKLPPYHIFTNIEQQRSRSMYCIVLGG